MANKSDAEDSADISLTLRDIILYPLKDLEGALGIAYIVSAIALGVYSTYNSLAGNDYDSQPKPQLENVVDQTHNPGKGLI